MTKCRAGFATGDLSVIRHGRHVVSQSPTQKYCPPVLVATFWYFWGVRVYHMRHRRHVLNIPEYNNFILLVSNYDLITFVNNYSTASKNI